MKKRVKSREENAVDSSPLSRLPDEIILQILNKLIDLKSLCFCYLVSRRFSSIVLQVDAISFTTPPLNPPNTFGDVAPSKPLHPIISSCSDQSFRSAFIFLYKFRAVKSFCIELSYSGHIGNDNPCLFKWKVKFNNGIESVFFLSPHSISDADGLYVSGNGEEEDMEIKDQFIRKVPIGVECAEDVVYIHRMLFCTLKNLPMLEEVSITDSGRRGRLSLSGGKLAEVKRSELPRLSGWMYCYVPVLKLPVSGLVMKGITFFVMEMKDLKGRNDSVMMSEDGFEDKEEAAYTEAVMEILKKYKGRMHRVMM